MEKTSELALDRMMDTMEGFITGQEVTKNQRLLPWTDSKREEIGGYLKTAQGIETLIRDEYFLGLRDLVYDAVLEDIIDLWEERKKREINLAIFVEGIGSGKCKHARTVIPTTEGLLTLSEIADQCNFIKASGSLLLPGGYKIDKGDKYTTSTFKIHSSDHVEECAFVYDSGIVPTIKIRTRAGFESEGTPHHCELVLDDYGKLKWKKLEELKIGDYIIVKSNTDLWGKENIDIDTAWLIGKNSYTKKVPLLIRKSSKETVKAFIRGYFDASGSPDKKGNIRISSVNKTLIRQVQLLLLNMGIFSTSVLKKTSCNGKKRTAWGLKINGEYARKFYNEIGFSSKRKQTGIERLKGFDDSDIIPNISEYCYRVYSGCKRCEIKNNKMINPSKRELKLFLEEFKDTENQTDWNYLNYLVNNNFHFLQIEEISSGTGQVYDLTVPESNNFVADGFVSHNTLKASIIQWLMWLELTCVAADPQVFYNLIPNSVIAWITLSKTEKQSKRIAFGELFHRFQSPFNKDYFPSDSRYSQELRISRNNTTLFPGTSSAMSALGYNLFGGTIDEANFLEVIEDSKKAAMEDRYDAAEDMYNAIMNRMISRFMKAGKIPGLLCMISSPRYPTDFLERKIEESEKLGTASGVFWRRRPLWKAKGKKFYPSGAFFYVNSDTLEEITEEKGKKIIKFRNMLVDMKNEYEEYKLGKRFDWLDDL